MGERLIGEQWRRFADIVLPHGCSDIQRQEMRRAFYAGAEAFLTVVLRYLEPGTEPTGPDLRLMDDIEAELKAFAADVKARRA